MSLQRHNAVIETLLGCRIERARLAIRLEAVSPAAEKYLAMNAGSSAIILERTSYLAAGQACEHTVFEIRPERFEFVLDTQSGDYSNPQDL